MGNVLTSSGTYTFAPSLGSLALSAFSRIQLRRSALLAEHIADAAAETNFLFSSWSNLAPNLFTVDLVSVPLIANQATYSVDASTVMILDAYIEYGTPAIDRLIFPISRTEYASYPDKAQTGITSVFWFDRILSPTITVWPVPDVSSTYTIKYYRCTQLQDAALQSGQTPGLPYRFLDAMVADLSHRLARIWKPELEQVRLADSQRAWAIAATQDVENVALNITPQLSAYRA